MKFIDLFDLDEIQKIQDAFAISLGVASIILSLMAHLLPDQAIFADYVWILFEKHRKDWPIA